MPRGAVELGRSDRAEPAVAEPWRPAAAKNTEVAMKMIAVIVVTRVSRLSAPLAPNSVFEPPPKAAPMSAPFPC
jgi:hypothetical protein